ncbi:MAG: exodeoxyribonuclease VII large subunit, partial [Peptostreptococcales bacterium]
MKLNALKVSQVNNYISRIIHSDPVLNNIRVIGEISNLKYHGNGYIFFTLKDEKSRLNCYVSQENSRYIKYIMDNGMEVTAAGYVYVFEKSGSYTLNVTDID